MADSKRRLRSREVIHDAEHDAMVRITQSLQDSTFDLETALLNCTYNEVDGQCVVCIVSIILTHYRIVQLK